MSKIRAVAELDIFDPAAAWEAAADIFFFNIFVSEMSGQFLATFALFLG